MVYRLQVQSGIDDKFMGRLARMRAGFFEVFSNAKETRTDSEAD